MCVIILEKQKSYMHDISKLRIEKQHTLLFSGHIHYDLLPPVSAGRAGASRRPSASLREMRLEEDGN